MRLIPSIVFAIFVSGCTTVTDPFLETGSISADVEPIASSVSPEFALAYIPAVAGRITGVRQSVREDYAEQYIVYENRTVLQNENVLTVRVGKPLYNRPFQNAPTSREIIKELGWYFPGVRMRIKQAVGENQQGVYGYATGRIASGGSCLYAWQLATKITPKSGEFFKDAARSDYRAQIRLRFCHPSIDEGSIVSLMEGLRVKPVTQQTFELLRYAAGTGQIAEAGAFTGSLAEDAHTSAKEADEPVRRKRRTVVEKTRETAGEGRLQPFRNAARIPLPEEVGTQTLAASVPAEEEKAVRKSTRARSALVPMPETVTLSSR